ncbi:MAG: hypothetical protein CVV02_17270 [Firmicutes bacterium HGW-Firmicutes-7]|nr:MAG: hypothetical protein CVV02_17270 [Firmicutes bacterium HGW-Firmicutes-7]
MKKSLTKSFILVLLIVASIYQIITLWFDDVSDRNFFYSFLDRVNEIISEPKGEFDKEYMTSPRMLGVFIGISDKDFTIIEKKNIDYDKILGESMTVFNKVLSNGQFEGVYDDASALWQSRGLIFSLSLIMSKEALASDFNVNVSTFGELSSVQTMGIIPAKEKADKIKVYFIDEQTNQVYIYGLDEKELKERNNNINSYINTTESKTYPPYYSSLKNVDELFKGNILLPLPTSNIRYNNKIKLTTPFVINENFGTEDLEIFVNGFFDNPNVKWTIQNSSDMKYGDDHALVKYNNKAIFEYSSIISNNKVSLGLSEAFNVAEEFIVKDVLLVKGDYQLSSYEKQGEKTIFYYEYEFDGLPLLMDKQLLVSNNMKYPIEITIESGKVVKYKRLLFYMNGVDREEAFSSEFVEALNSFVDKNDIRKEQLDDMYLGYVMNDNNVKLMWIIKYNGKVYSLEL